MKYTAERTRRIPAKIRKVTDVPTAGIETNVGTKVPMMLPIVLDAFKYPTVFPLSSSESVEYLTRQGVTVPRRNRGKTKIIIHAAKAAMTRKFVLTVRMSKPEMPRMMYLPTTGISAIHTAAMIILP